MIHTAYRDPHRRLQQQLDKMFSQLGQVKFSEFSSMDSWSPAINLYHLHRRLELSVDLAGLDPNSVQVRVEQDRVVLRGYRSAPDPRQGDEPMRILTMEINHGPFCRVVELPEQVDLARVKTQYCNGLLWVRMPLRDPG